MKTNRGKSIIDILRFSGRTDSFSFFPRNELYNFVNDAFSASSLISSRSRRHTHQQIANAHKQTAQRECEKL